MNRIIRSFPFLLILAPLHLSVTATWADTEHGGNVGVRPAKEPTIMHKTFPEVLLAFRHEVAAQYQKPAAGLEIIPASADLAGFPEQQTGDLIAFQANFAGRQIRGWASAQGEVVFYAKGNIGVLLRAAALLNSAQALPAQELAQRLTWMLGPEYRLIRTRQDYRGRALPGTVELQPVIVYAKDGSAMLTFLANKTGQTGLGQTIQVAVQCLPDYQAVLTTKPVF